MRKGHPRNCKSQNIAPTYQLSEKMENEITTFEAPGRVKCECSENKNKEIDQVPGSRFKTSATRMGMKITKFVAARKGLTLCI